MLINVDFGALKKQTPITLESIKQMVTLRPRRMKLSDEWPEPLHEPRNSDHDWSLVLPFCETLKNAFEGMCSATSIGLRVGRNGRCYTFFPDQGTLGTTLDEVRGVLENIGRYVAIRDCLALSFALDYDRVGGDPSRTQTPIGRLRSRAKPYQRDATDDTYVAANELVSVCVEFLGNMTCYGDATCVVGMPPSDPNRDFNLPRYVVKGISEKMCIPDGSAAVKTIKPRGSVRETRVSEKLGIIEETISVDPHAVRNEVILLVDDLYQSGVSMNYTGMLLMEAGAKRIYGLACEKTCSNDDNVRV